MGMLAALAAVMGAGMSLCAYGMLKGLKQVAVIDIKVRHTARLLSKPLLPPSGPEGMLHRNMPCAARSLRWPGVARSLQRSSSSSWTPSSGRWGYASCAAVQDRLYVCHVSL